MNNSIFHAIIILVNQSFIYFKLIFSYDEKIKLFQPVIIEDNTNNFAYCVYGKLSPPREIWKSKDYEVLIVKYVSKPQIYNIRYSTKMLNHLHLCFSTARIY